MILLFGLLFLLYCAIDLLKVINLELEKKKMRPCFVNVYIDFAIMKGTKL